MTEYVVLSLDDSGLWSERATYAARSAHHAIRQFVDAYPGAGAEKFVAVPARSWKPVTVQVETKTALKFS